jgi:tetratricopeptide (TPR) repeat protein
MPFRLCAHKNQILSQPERMRIQGMSLLGTNLIVLAATTVVFWWLSGFDSHLSGHRGFRDLARRGARCGISLVIVETCFLFLWRYVKEKNADAGYIYLLVAMPLALLWCGCLSQMGARFFNALIDPEDPEQYQPDKEERLLEKIAELIRSGKKEQAIQLCKALKISGEVSVAALDMTLEHLGLPQNNGLMVKPLAAAHRLRRQGKFEEAAAMLKALLAKNPRDVDAAMPLMRIYAQDLHEPDQARQILKALEKQPYVAVAHLEFARRSIEEWSQPGPVPPDEAELTGSVDELLAQGFVGTAIEMLEEQVDAEPGNFDLQLKLAGFYARHAKNVTTAERIIRQMDGKFSPDQLLIARARLQEWQQG